MADSQDFLVRDTRLPGHFWADNEVLDIFGEQLGEHGFAAYMVLCRYATNGTGECKLSTRKLAKLLGMSAGGAFNALSIVLQVGLARQIHPGDRSNPATYSLVDVKALTNPEMAQLKLAGRGAHTVSTSQLGAHDMSAGAHPVNTGAHTVSGVLTPRARNKESKRLSSRLTRLQDFESGDSAKVVEGSTSVSSSKSADDDAETEFVRANLQKYRILFLGSKPRPYEPADVERTLQAFSESPLVARPVKNSDRQVALELLQIFSSREIERGIILATARRMCTDINHNQPFKVVSLAYFVEAISECKGDLLMTDEYIENQRRFIRRHAMTHKSLSAPHEKTQ
jgi:hypothetical protein